jgi:hypothetical protein
MSNTRGVASILLAIALLSLPGQAEAQGIGGLIKKKAGEVAKGKGGKADQEKNAVKDSGPITSAWALEDCGPLTPDKLNDFLRGLQAEATQRGEFDKVFRSLGNAATVVACRNQEFASPAAQKILYQGLTTGTPTAAQLEKMMAKNQLDLEKHMDQKCGKDPSKFNERNAHDNARRNGAKAADMTEACYDKLKEVVLGFCRMSPELQQTATQNGIRVPGKGKGVWVFTPNEAQAIKPKCGALVPAIETSGYKEAP